MIKEELDKLTGRSTALLEEAQKISDEWRNERSSPSLLKINSLASRGANLIHSVAGTKSVYAENLRNALKREIHSQQFLAIAGVLQAFHLDLSQGYLINIRHEVEAIIVSEILSQAKTLSESKSIHPAAAVIVACAAAEEFLRSWCEEKSIKIPNKQRSISRFAQELRAQNLIDLPIERRIQSWADYRNDAAHGSKWDKMTKKLADRLIHEIEEFIIENSKVVS